MGYKSTLRSSLITINYEKKFETLDDLVRAGMPMVFASVFHSYFSRDPRPTVQKLYMNGISYNWTGASGARWVYNK